MIQQLIVSAAVFTAVLATVWKLMPAKRRLRTLLALDRWAAKHPALARWRERSLKARITRAAGTGCAGCAANVGTRPNHPPR